MKRLKQCIKQRPWEPEAYFNLGSVYIQRGDRSKALQARRLTLTLTLPLTAHCHAFALTLTLTLTPNP